MSVLLAASSTSRTAGSSSGMMILFKSIATVVSAMFICPIVLSFLTSLRPGDEATTVPLPPWPQGGVSVENYAKFEGFGAGLLGTTANSLSVALGTMGLTVILSFLAGYGFSRFRFPARNALFVLIMITMMIPFQSILTPLFLIMTRIGLYNTLFGLILIYTTFQLPFSIFMMRNAFDAVPKEIEEAGRMDGANSVTLLIRVMLPLVMPGIVTVALFAFLNAWNEFLAALVFLADDQNYTLPVMLQTVQAGLFGAIDWGAVQAGVTITMIPCIILFVLLQKYYVSGLSAGSVK